jgi:hypothetical protein
MTELTATVEQILAAAIKAKADELIGQIRRPIPFVGDDGDVILTFQEWCDMAGLPESTARELRARGQGPRCVNLTGKKLGITLADHRRWMKVRMERA